jgi:hypothetical protein
LPSSWHVEGTWALFEQAEIVQRVEDVLLTTITARRSVARHSTNECAFNSTNEATRGTSTMKLRRPNPTPDWTPPFFATLA